MKNVVKIALETPFLSILAKLLQAADLVETVKNLQNATVFAPTNEAFDHVPSDILEELLQPENKHVLRKILLTHIVPQEIFARQIQEGAVVHALSNVPLEFHKQMGSVFVIAPLSTAKVLKADIRADNEVVIHLVSEVLMPEYNLSF